jgi:hypothetical protein
VYALVLGTALGWVWGVGMSVVAYQLLGQQRERAAGRVLRLFMVAGLALACLGAVVLALTGIGGPAMVAFALGQMGFQLASGVLVFYGRELRMVVLMLPATVLGVAHIALGYRPSLIVPTAAAAAFSVCSILTAAWIATAHVSDRPESQRRIAWKPVLSAAVLSTAYGAMCALMLLFTDARYVVGQFDLAIAVAPLVLGMGAIELCAHRFNRRSRALLDRPATPAQFDSGVWRVLIFELALCLLCLGALAFLLLIILLQSGQLTAAGAILIDAHVVLGGVFLVGFVMANHQQLPTLLAIFSAVTIGYVIVGIVAFRSADATSFVQFFLASSILLLCAMLVALRTAIGRVYYYR